MYSPRTPLTSKDYYLGYNQPNSARSLTSSKFSSKSLLDETNTKDQQARISRLIGDVKKGVPLSANSVILPQSELLRIKSSAAFFTRDELIQQKKLQEEQNEAQQAANRARKQKMLLIEAEKKKHMPPTESEMEKMIQNDAIRTRAKTMMDEERDDVKHMNKMMLYAKVVTTRDEQLLEKKSLKKQLQNEERRKDLNMELDRLKKIKYYENHDEIMRSEQRKAAEETIQQVKEREILRMKNRQQVEKEGQDMLRQIKENQIEDSKNTLIKKRQQKDLLDQIFAANQRAISSKHEKYKLELEEEEKITKYNIEKARKEAEYNEEQRRIKDEKEKEIQKLRELQQRATDRQAEVDNLRAKRAMEQNDRLAREKERRDAELKAKMNQELLEIRFKQSLEKQYRLQEQARSERDEFQKIVENQKQSRLVEQYVETEKKNRVYEHAEQLKKQIALNEEKKKLSRKEYLEDGKLIRGRLNEEKELLEDIKSKKLGELQDLGISNKYASELAKKRIII